MSGQCRKRRVLGTVRIPNMLTGKMGHSLVLACCKLNEGHRGMCRWHEPDEATAKALKAAEPS